MELKLLDMEEKSYRSTREFIAYPMTRAEYNCIRGWAVPNDENPMDEGVLLITDIDTDDEHLCWVTLKVFHNGYEEII